MKLLILLLGTGLTGVAVAFPPAPHHELYGLVRDESGTPLSGGATIRLNGPSGPVVWGSVDPFAALGVNYSLKVPMDSGAEATLYQSTALLPAQPFTVEVIIDGTSYVPIEAQGTQFLIGNPGGKTRLDLTLGVDSDGDGLPDAWEQEVIEFSSATSLADVTPDGDNDGDGVSNWVEYRAGTYAFSGLAVFRLDIIEIKDGFAHTRFLATTGRSYTITTSTDGVSYVETPFSLHADGSDEREAFRSAQTRFEEVWVPTHNSDARLFRLHVH